MKSLNIRRSLRILQDLAVKVDATGCQPASLSNLGAAESSWRGFCD
jgi:hypothetical protein